MVRPWTHSNQHFERQAVEPDNPSGAQLDLSRRSIPVVEAGLFIRCAVNDVTCGVEMVSPEETGIASGLLEHLVNVQRGVPLQWASTALPVVSGNRTLRDGG